MSDISFRKALEEAPDQILDGMEERSRQEDKLWAVVMNLSLKDKELLKDMLKEYFGE